MAGRNRSARHIGRTQVESFVRGIFEEDVHAKRVASLANAVDGVLHAARLGIRAIGQGRAAAQDLAPRHAIQQVERLLSNPKPPREQIFACRVGFVIGEREETFVHFAWTEFEDSDQSRGVRGMQTSHGRSTARGGTTVTRSELGGQRNGHEDDLLLAAILPRDVRAPGVADRGFGDTRLDRFLREELGFDSRIRFRGGIPVEAERAERGKAREWVGRGGRMRVLREARVTAAREPVPGVVRVRERGLEDAWGLATSREDLSGSWVKRARGRRFSVEETFRPLKNPRPGRKQTGVTRKDRREERFLLATLAHALLAHALLPLLGKAGQDLGPERWLGARRPGGILLFRQGLLLYELLPPRAEERRRTLMQRFGEIVRQHALFTGIPGVL